MGALTRLRSATRHPAARARFWELARFGAVGVINTAVYFVGFVVLHSVLPYLLAHVIAFGVGVVVSFFLNCAFTFRVRPTWGRFVRFPISNLTTFLVMTGGVSLLVEVFGADPDVAALVSALVGVPASYLVSRLLLVGRLGHTSID